MGLHHYGPAMGEILDAYERTVVAGLLCEDTHTGRVVAGPGGRPIALYDVSPFDLDRIQRGAALLCELLFEAGARRIALPFGGLDDLTHPEQASRILTEQIPKSAIELVTVHLMGTARMGGDRAGAVTDGFGRVYDAERLFVADASLFPSAVGVNPAETIQALATRNAAHIIENRRSYLA